MGGGFFCLTERGASGHDFLLGMAAGRWGWETGTLRYAGWLPQGKVSSGRNLSLQDERVPVKECSRGHRGCFPFVGLHTATASLSSPWGAVGCCHRCLFADISQHHPTKNNLWQMMLSYRCNIILVRTSSSQFCWEWCLFAFRVLLFVTIMLRPF